MRTELRRPLASVGLTALLLLTAATVPAVAGVAPSPAASPGAVTGPSAHPPGLEAVACAEGAPVFCEEVFPLDRQTPLRDGAGKPLGEAKEAKKMAGGWEFSIGDPATTWYLVSVRR